MGMPPAGTAASSAFGAPGAGRFDLLSLLPRVPYSRCPISFQSVEEHEDAMLQEAIRLSMMGDSSAGSQGTSDSQANPQDGSGSDSQAPPAPDLD